MTITFKILPFRPVSPISFCNFNKIVLIIPLSFFLLFFTYLMKLLQIKTFESSKILMTFNDPFFFSIASKCQSNIYSCLKVLPIFYIYKMYIKIGVLPISSLKLFYKVYQKSG